VMDGDVKPEKGVKPLAVRYADTRRTLKGCKEQVKTQAKRSRQLIAAVGAKLKEKEREVQKVRSEKDHALSYICQQLFYLQGNMTREQVRVAQLLQDKENIIQSQRQEIDRLRAAIALGPRLHGSFRQYKRDRAAATGGHKAVCPGQVSTSTDESSSPSAQPRHKQLSRKLSDDKKRQTEENNNEKSIMSGPDGHEVLARKLSDEVTTQAGTSLMRQSKIIRGVERPPLRTSHSTGSSYLPTLNALLADPGTAKIPKGILKPSSFFGSLTHLSSIETPSKPPIPSRDGVNEKLEKLSSLMNEDLMKKPGSPSDDSGRDSDAKQNRRWRSSSRKQPSADSGNSSFDSSDPSSTCARIQLTDPSFMKSVQLANRSIIDQDRCSDFPSFGRAQSVDRSPMILSSETLQPSSEWKLSVRSMTTKISEGSSKSSLKQKINSQLPCRSKLSKPPPPPRRSKSYERPVSTTVNKTKLDFSTSSISNKYPCLHDKSLYEGNTPKKGDFNLENNFEEYLFENDDEKNPAKGGKHVSFHTDVDDSKVNNDIDEKVPLFKKLSPESQEVVKPLDPNFLNGLSSLNSLHSSIESSAFLSRLMKGKIPQLLSDNKKLLEILTDNDSFKKNPDGDNLCGENPENVHYWTENYL